jgi:hypothetical protein
MKLDIIGASYRSRARNVDCQECVNFYPEIEQGSSKNVIALIGTPGLKPFTTAAVTGRIRGLYTSSDDRLFAVCENKFYEIGEGGAYPYGALNTTTGQVYFADNGNQLVLTDGVYGYIFDLKKWTDSADVIREAGTFTRIPDAAFPGGGRVAFINGVFVVNKPNSGEFRYSDPYDGRVWNALNHYNAEGAPDGLLANIVSKNELWLIGKQTSEVWYMTGDAEDPFARVHGALNNIGTAAADSVATNGNTVFWLGSNAAGQGVVWAATGYNPERISTHGVEYLISGLSRIDDAVGYCYQQEGHAFYVLNFLTGGKTLVYDQTTGLWHERAYFDATNGVFQSHPVTCHSAWKGQNFVGGYRNGKIYTFDFDTYTDDGETIKRVRTTAHQSAENKRITYNSLEIEAERGAGLTQAFMPLYTGSTVLEPGVMPLVILNISNDGGATWSDNKYASVGKIGEYKIRCRWTRLGSARDRVFRFSITDPVKCVLIAGYADLEVET